MTEDVERAEIPDHLEAEGRARPHEVVEVTITYRCRLVGRRHLLLGVRSGRLEQSEARTAVDHDSVDERLRDQRLQEIRRCRPRRIDDGCCGVDSEGSHEHAERAKGRLFVGVEQVVAPVERRLEDALALASSAAVQECEAIVDSFEQLRW